MQWAGAVLLVDNHTADHRALEEKTAREKHLDAPTAVFRDGHVRSVNGIIRCPTLLNDPEARDRVRSPGSGQIPRTQVR